MRKLVTIRNTCDGSAAAQLAHAPAVVRVDHVEEQHAAQEVHAAHGVAPDADGADKQDEILESASNTVFGTASASTISRLRNTSQPVASARPRL